jgi:uncharacterized protein (DUF2252 family)
VTEPGRYVPRAERVEWGRSARKVVARSRHGEWAPAAARPDPIDLLERQAESRVPELVPVRYGRMLVSPFAFFRGAAAIMASDLASTPVSGYRVQACGDAHLSNFGIFGTPERKFVFDMNDFDETLPAPWEWDMKRLAASFAVAGREGGLSRRQRARVLAAGAAAYRSTMRSLAADRAMHVWYSHLQVHHLLRELRAEFSASRLTRVEADVAKARTKDSMRAVRKLTAHIDGERRFLDDPPLVVTLESLFGKEGWHAIADEVESMVASYRSALSPERRDLLDQYRLVHVARKVVGVGSVGTRAWIALFVGVDSDDPLVLQVKEAQASVLEPFAGASEFAHHGERVVVGQRRLQAAGDALLGWTRIERGLDGEQRDYYVRQLWDWKGSATLEGMSPRGLAAYARICGATLARAHARTGDRVGIAAYVGSGDVLDRALVRFAETYADQTELDYATLQAAVESGRVVAETAA